MEKLTLREDLATKDEPQAKGLGGTSGEHNTLSDAEIRRFEVGNAANNSFPEIDASLLDHTVTDETFKATDTNSHLIEDNLAWTSEVKTVTKDPKVVEQILAGTNLTVAPEEIPGTYRETVPTTDPTAPTAGQLKTTEEIFTSTRPKNLDRVIPTEAPLGDPTRHGKAPIDIASAQLVPPHKIQHGTDRTPAAEYLNSEKPVWQTPPKVAPQEASNTDSFFGKIRSWLGK